MSKISPHFFHSLYSSNYNVFGDIYYGQFEIPIIDFPVIFGVPSDIDYQQERPIYYWQNSAIFLDLLRGNKKILEFKSEDDAFIWYKKTSNRNYYDKLKVPLTKNYFKFNKKDFYKYRFLFNGMIKTGRIISNFNVDYKAQFTSIFPEFDGTQDVIKKEQSSITFNTNIYNDFNGTILLNDQNFKNRVPFNKMHYAGGFFDDAGSPSPGRKINVLNTEELFGYNAPISFYSNSNTDFIYNQDWIFNENFLTINKFPFFRKYPYDRSNLNNPVFPYKVTNAYNSPELNFSFGSKVAINSEEKKFEFDKVGNINATLDYKVTPEPQDGQGFVSAGNNFSVQLSAVLYLKESKEFLVFFEYYNEINTPFLNTVSTTLEWRFRNPSQNTPIYISEIFHQEGRENTKEIGFKKKNVDIFIETDGNNFINHTIEVLIEDQSRFTRGIYNSSPVEENIGDYLDSSNLNFDISKESIYIYGWKKEDFSTELRYPEP
jgi:hypothetical protein